MEPNIELLHVRSVCCWTVGSSSLAMRQRSLSPPLSWTAGRPAASETSRGRNVPFSKCDDSSQLEHSSIILCPAQNPSHRLVAIVSSMRDDKIIQLFFILPASKS